MKVPLLPVNRKRIGKITQGRMYRVCTVYGLMFVAGLLLSYGLSYPALGLSFIAPGGGLLHYATGDAYMFLVHAGLFLAVQLTFLVALALWVATGNVIAPLLVWLLSGAWAATMQHAGHMHGQSWAAWGLPLAVGVAWLAYALFQRRVALRQVKNRDQLNQSLQGVETATTPVDENGLPVTRELTLEELAFSRYFYDRALQPVEGFEGFDKLDQFREAAFRYQIFYISNSLTLQSGVSTPAMRAYYDEAQDNLMQKMLLHPVWSYWQIENIWGNFNWDPNPLPDDNVMYTGWYAAAMGMYISTTGSEKYNAPGSLKLRNKNGEVAYTTSFPELCATLLDNFRRSDYTLFACEPKFIYPICSGFGATALKIHDRLYGSHYWAEIEDKYRHSLENEFITMDGRVTAIRCYRTGVSVPGLTSAMADAAASFYLNGYIPDLARRSWEVARNSLLSMKNARPVLKKAAWDKIDFGNYKRVPAATNGLFAMAAREMGDHDVADLLVQETNNTVANEIVNGVKHYKTVSVGGHAAMFGATLGRTNASHDIVSHGLPEEWINGPVLDKAKYPEVLVAKAVSDGQDLDLVLYPGTEIQQVSIEIAQLCPNEIYTVAGIFNSDVEADESGRLSLSLFLDGRSEVTIKRTV